MLFISTVLFMTLVPVIMSLLKGGTGSLSIKNVLTDFKPV